MDHSKYKKDFKKTNEIMTDSFLRYVFEEKIFFEKHIKSTDTVLEVGSGFGRLIAQIAPLVYSGRMLGVEIDKNTFNANKKQLSVFRNVHLEQCDAKNMPFDNNSVDIVLLPWNLIGNWTNKERESVFMELKRVLKIKGYVLASVYSKEALDYQLEQYELTAGGPIYYDKDFVTIPKIGFKSQRFSKVEISKLFPEMSIEIENICEMAYGIKLEF